MRFQNKNNQKKKETPKKKNSKKQKKEEDDESSEKQEPKHIQTVISKGDAVVDINFPNASSYHVVADTKREFNGKHFSSTLNKSDLVHNNNKFYIIQLLQNDDNQNGFKFYTRWGRVGVVGQDKIEHCSSLEAGIKLFQKKYSEKTNGGYDEIIIDYSEDKKEENSSKKSVDTQTLDSDSDNNKKLWKQIDNIILMFNNSGFQKYDEIRYFISNIRY